MGETPGTFWGLAVLASDKNSVVCGGGGRCKRFCNFSIRSDVFQTVEFFDGLCLRFGQLPGGLGRDAAIWNIEDSCWICKDL